VEVFGWFLPVHQSGLYVSKTKQKLSEIEVLIPDISVVRKEMMMRLSDVWLRLFAGVSRFETEFIISGQAPVWYILAACPVKGFHEVLDAGS